MYFALGPVVWDRHGTQLYNVIQKSRIYCLYFKNMPAINPQSVVLSLYRSLLLWTNELEDNELGSLGMGINTLPGPKWVSDVFTPSALRFWKKCTALPTLQLINCHPTFCTETTSRQGRTGVRPPIGLRKMKTKGPL
jgi:hypothetical protein